MSDQDFEIEVVAVEQLRPNEYNPNQQSANDFELLLKSIQEDGFTLPVIVNDGSMDPELTDMIIDGEHRWRAAQVLGMPEIPVIYKPMDKAGMRVSTIRHNVARGEHDSVMEAQVLAELAGEIGTDEISEQLNIDPVELDIMLERATNYGDADELSGMLLEEKQQQLEAQGVPTQEAGIVAHRHAMIDAGLVRKGQDAVQQAKEAYQNVRIELVYAGEQAVFMAKMVSKYGSGLRLFQAIREFSQNRKSS